MFRYWSNTISLNILHFCCSLVAISSTHLLLLNSCKFWPSWAVFWMWHVVFSSFLSLQEQWILNHAIAKIYISLTICFPERKWERLHVAVVFLCTKLFSLLCLWLAGLTAKVIDRTKTMSDVYGAFFDFSCMLKSKVCGICGLKQSMVSFASCNITM